MAAATEAVESAALPSRGPRSSWRRGRAVTATAVGAGDLGAVACAVQVAELPLRSALPLAVAAVVACAPGRARHGALALSALLVAPRLATRLVVAGAAVTFVTPDDQLRALWRAVPVLVVACVLFRGVSYALVRSGRRAGRLHEPVVLVGAGTMNVDLARSLLADRSYGLAPIGFLDDRPPDQRTLPLPVLGGPERLAEVVAGTGCGRVVVGFGLAREPDLVAVLRSGLPRRVVVYVIPRFFDLGVLPAHGPVEHVEAVPLVPLRLGDHRSLQFRCKRLVDVVVAGLALVALAPLFAVIALAVKLSSPGPVFHRQIRIGRHGRPIVVRKFRSLRVPEAVHLQVVDLDPVRTQLERDLDVRARMTRVGALLRRTALDELPQLWNVLRGDMSLVGPRPEELRYAEQFDRTVRGYGDRHRFPGGLTGWAQVHGLRGATSIETRARFDNHYIEHWSLWLDAVIVLRTAGVILRDLSGRANPARQLSWDRRKAER